jgi:hypothetical protein
MVSAAGTQSAPPRRRTGSNSRAIGSFVPHLTQKAFEKYGFSAAALLTEWTAIAGPELAGFTQPERLKWPRGVDAYAEVAADARHRPGATLVLRVDGARALDVQYQARQIVERINAYFGYRAVADLRFVQAPVAARPLTHRPHPLPAPAPLRARPVPHRPATETDLRAALERLEANIQAGRQPARATVV